MVRGEPGHAGSPFCRLELYRTPEELVARFGEAIRRADAVIVGSYVPDGVEVIDAVMARAGGPVAFYDIDTPVTLAGLRAGREEYLAARQIPLFDVYLSFSGGPTLDMLRDAFGARLALPLHCCVDTDLYVPGSGEGPFEWDLGYLGTYSPDRQPKLEALLIEPARRLPDLRFVVAGPCYPQDIDWPANVRRIEHLPPAEHPGFYRAQRFTLNVTRADMVSAGWSPSVRLFEAAACGTPIISDDWAGLDDLLPEGEAVLVARGSDDVVAALAGMPGQQRQRIADAALARIQKGHDAVARARELVAGLRGAMSTAPESRNARVAAAVSPNA